MMKQLMGYIQQYRKYFILAPLLVVGESLAELILPYLMGLIVDNGVAAKDVDFWLNRGSFFTEPLHIAVGSPSERCRVLRCVSHIDRQLGNKGTVWGIAPKFHRQCAWRSSPASCLSRNSLSSHAP